MNLVHPFKPVYDECSQILILGSFPSLKSRENDFYYGHSQNLFWRLLGSVFKEEVPLTNEQKVAFLLSHHIALWDVINSCSIKGSDDASITNAEVNDFAQILKQSNITTIFTTGKKATNLYMKYCYPKTKIASIYLPSPSPANRAYGNFERFTEAYQIIRQTLEK